MKRVIVTGGSGFIGANLARRLLREGHETHLLLRPSHRPWRIREIERDVRIHLVSLEDRDSVSHAVRSIRPEWVFNLASHGAYSSETDADRMIATNLTGCMSLLDACARTGVDAFVQAGSSSEYGYKDHPADEGEPIQPNSHYAVTKAAATHLCQLMARLRDLNAVTLRLYSVFGPYEEPARLIPTLITQGFHGRLPPLVSPRTARDFVFVDDALEAMLSVARTAPAHRGAIYNVCSGVQTDLASVVDTARRLLSIDAEPEWRAMAPRPWDTDVWVGSTSKAKQEMNWSASTTFENGLGRTITWFRGLPEWLMEIYSYAPTST